MFSVILSLGGLHAQERTEADTVSIKVYFRQGYSVFEPAFQRNGERMKAFVEEMRRTVEQDALQQMPPVRIIGAASPEGKMNLNKKLAEKRAANLEAWMKANLNLEGIMCSTSSVGVDWEGLTLLVEESDMPYKEEVLNILYHTPVWVIRDGKVVDGKKRQLEMLHGGKAWWYMYEHLFPELRSSSVEIAYVRPRKISQKAEITLPDTVVVRDTVYLFKTDTVFRPMEVRKAGKPFYMAIKTNMLYDAALVPNIGAEFYLGKGWSVAGNWMYAWWKSDKKHNYWRIYGGELDVRKYLGKKAEEKPLQGHHLGVYGQLLTYDLELGGRGYLGDKWSWGTGVEYGYSLPVAERLNIDFVIGVGYLGGEYKEYLPIDGHYVWQTTKQRHWFGPTKAEISLIWLLGRGNANPKKGGEK